MSQKRLVVVLVMLTCAASAVANDDCDDPVKHWQSQEKLRRMLERHAWHIRRIKVDDGCYEVYGIDHAGNRFEAKYSPASLKLRSLEIQFKHGGNIGEYLDGTSVPAADESALTNTGHQKHGRAGKMPATTQE